MTKEQFIARWMQRMAGYMLYGYVSEEKHGPVERTAFVLKIPAEAERLLGLMFDDLTRAAPPNGQPQGEPPCSIPRISPPPAPPKK